MTFAERLGANLREARRRSDMTQTSVAAQMCLTSSAISQYEKGIRVPCVMYVAMMSEIYGTSLDDIVPPVEVPGEKIDESQMKGEW